MGCEVFHALKKVLKDKGLSTAVGDEGGFAPKLESIEAALDAIALAVKNAGYKLGKDVALALDPAASEFYVPEKKRYVFKKSDGRALTGDQMVEFYKQLVAKYPIISIEDGCAENDWETWKKLTDALGDKIQLVGDDLFVTNTEFLKKGIDERRRQLDPGQGQPDRLAHRDPRRHRDGQGGRLHRRHLPPLRRDRGHDDRRHRGGDQRRPDQDRLALPHRPRGEVQPAPPHRGGAGRQRDLRRQDISSGAAGPPYSTSRI